MHPDIPQKPVWVFRTSVTTHVDVLRLKPLLNSLIRNTDKWNFDLEDVDHILRVESRSLLPADIIWHMQEAGYTCEELDDTLPFPRLGHQDSFTKAGSHMAG